MAVTLKDIAERVDRSVATVSRALAGYDDVSQATREQIKQVAQELGYEPNITARQLQKRRTDTLDLILPTFGPHFSDPFFSEFLAGVGNQAARQGFDLLVSTHAPGDEEKEAYLKIFAAGGLMALSSSAPGDRTPVSRSCKRTTIPLPPLAGLKVTMIFRWWTRTTRWA